MASRASGNDGGSHRPLVSDYARDSEMVELVEFFITELQTRIEALCRAWETGDEAALNDLAHQLKDAAEGYGYPSITQSAAELEAALLLEEAQASAIAEKAESLIALCKRAVAGAQP